MDSNLRQELSQFLQTQHRRRASTNGTYGAILEQFISFAQERAIVVAVSDFLSSKQLKPATYNLYLSAITSFLFERRLISREDRDDLRRNRAAIIQAPYSEHALSASDVTRLFSYLRHENARTNRVRQQRDLCIFLLQYACAMRISEVLTLRPDDIAIADVSTMVTVRAMYSKTNLERTIPLRFTFDVAGLNVAAELNAWLRLRTAYADHLQTPFVFFTLRRSTFGRAVNTERMIEKYNSIKMRLGITAGRSTHALRHTRITNLANNPEIPLPVISEFAGHHSKGQPNIRTTSLYIQRPKPDDMEKYL